MNKYILMVLKIILFIVIFYLVNSFLVESYRVVGASMEPTYKEGDLLIILKLKNDYKRDDVVILEKGGEVYIKRILGLPGEHLEFASNRFLINGVVREPLINSTTENFETVISNNGYFVLGDNRSISKDSRVFGEIKEEEIIGKVILKYFNINKK